eukprot:m.257255 g.257255  ORF g.257255 m.257255 type:complete len:78 (-) comp26585_c0_seq3:132-365(-)
MGICSSTARCDPAVTPISPVAPLPTNDVTEKESRGGEGMEDKEDVVVDHWWWWRARSHSDYPHRLMTRHRYHHTLRR